MALLFMDGFDANDVAIKWDTATDGTSSTTRFGSGLSLSFSSGGSMTKFITASAQVTYGFALRWGGDDFYVTLLSDNNTTRHITLKVNETSKRFEVRRGTDSGTVLATGTQTVLEDQWIYVEFQGTVNDSTGTAKLRLNGSTTEEIDFTGDTKNGGTNTNIDSVLIVATSGSTSYVDDVYILNSTGSSNTTFLGDVRIHTLSPDGNGNSSQLTGSDGNSVDNYQQVDELPYSTSDYNGSATATNKDTYTLSNLPASVATVFGVQNNMVAAKSDASAASARTVLRTGGTDFTGTTNVLGTSYINYRDIYDVNPDTTIAWTASDVDGLESGMEVV